MYAYVYYAYMHGYFHTKGHMCIHTYSHTHTEALDAKRSKITYIYIYAYTHIYTQEPCAKKRKTTECSKTLTSLSAYADYKITYSDSELRTMARYDVH
jgi:hypothetical protein